MKTETRIPTVNHGIPSPVAKADLVHGVFNKQTGELLSFTATDTSCNVDYTNQLTQEQKARCRNELIASFNINYRAKSA